MTFLVWRFRPGQRTRIEVPVEKFANVYVLPAEAVVREGADAYVYRQNGDLFNQIAVHILHEDRTQVVLEQRSKHHPRNVLGSKLSRIVAASDSKLNRQADSNQVFTFTRTAPSTRLIKEN